MNPLRALVVDDSPLMRRSIALALQRIPSLSCEEAQDGAEGLRKFGGSPFDLVVTDVNMPLMDGLKLIHHLRSGAFRQVPIVVVTTESAEADRQRALALGANAYLTKPVQAHVVVETVRELLSLPR
jgi:two-component system chemotaxis response regulator CheY